MSVPCKVATHRVGLLVAAAQAGALFLGTHLAAEPGVGVVPAQVHLRRGSKQRVHPLQQR